MTAYPNLTFAELSTANISRCRRWHPGFPADEKWTGADWSNALGGEGGELLEAAAAVAARVGLVQNTVKKIRRYETGTNTDVDKPLEVLLTELDAEMADVSCYLDLLATKYGRDLPAAIVAKFNAVSERQDFPERLPLGGGLCPACAANLENPMCDSCFARLGPLAAANAARDAALDEVTRLREINHRLAGERSDALDRADEVERVIHSPRQYGRWCEAYGVTLSNVGEDGEWIALGHVEPLRMIAAIRKAARAELSLDDAETFGYSGPDSGTLADLVKHTRAVFTQHEECDWWANWAPDAKHHPAACDVTIWGA